MRKRRGGLSDEGEVLVLGDAVVAFVLFEQVAELAHVALVKLVQLLFRRLLVLLHRDRLPH